MSYSTEVVVFLVFGGLLMLMIGYGNRYSRWGLLLIFAGVVSMLSIFTYHIFVVLNGGY